MTASRQNRRPTVALFVTCMVDALYPHVGLAAAEVLERYGAHVVVPSDQTCCGQPAFNAGYRADARAVAQHFIDVFWPLIDRGEAQAIVAPSGSCIAMVKHGYEMLFEREPDERGRRRAAALARVTYEFSEYLVDVLGANAADVSFPETVTYHPCCHLLRDLGVDAQPRRLLRGIRDATFVDLPEAGECCGFGGLFAIKNAPISTAMGQRKAGNVSQSGADIVVMNDAGCIAHVNGILVREGRRCRAVHIAELLNAQVGQDAEAS